MNVTVVEQVYYQPICPSLNCKGELVVDFDNYEDPTCINIVCKRCGGVVATLGERSPSIDKSINLL